MMNKPLVIFGCGKIAEVVLYYFKNHSDREVVACCTDRPYLPGEQWKGLPTVAFDEIAAKYPAKTHEMFVALGYQGMNDLREAKCREARALGYTLASYLPADGQFPLDCVHGDNCFFMPGSLVHPCVRFGDNVFVWSGAMIGHHSEIGDNCWITSCANIAGGVTVGNNCFFAVNSTVGNSVCVGKRCFFGANALVAKSTDDNQVFLAEASKAFRLSSDQFLRMSRFNDM